MRAVRPLLASATVIAMALAPVASSAIDADEGTDLPFPAPVDPASWSLPEWQTLDDYRAIPGVDWNDPDLQAAKPIRAAMVLADFADRPFVATMDAGTDVFGVTADWASRVPGFEHLAEGRDDDEIVLANPVADGPGLVHDGAPVTDDNVADFYADLIVNSPSATNNFHTVNEYWLEDSYGLIGVEATGFGPYHLEGEEHEYGFGGDSGGDRAYQGGSGSACPAGSYCTRDFDTEVLEASTVDTVTGMATNLEDYDFRWFLHAGYDESGTWQEFGEMMWSDPADIAPEFGPPAEHGNPDHPNAVGTRYVPWTSWAAGEGIWSHALPGVYSTQGENDGSAVFAHELSHIFGVLDNYNNPYATAVRRSYTGPWAMLSRGAFNGPGGAHTRWQIPAVQGASMGSHHMLRNKIRLGFTKPNELLITTPQLLAATGPVVADIYPRAYPLFPITDDIGLHGLVIEFGVDASDCDDLPVELEHTCDGGGYDHYTVEVVDQMGHDSYTPDHGVLIAKNKTGVDLAPFIWAIDANPGDINAADPVGEHADREIYDFVRPDGTRAAISLGDMRQLSDALFHAGTGEGVVNTWVDEANRLQFYVLTTDHDATDPESVGTYRVAVRSLDGHGPVDPATTILPSSTTDVLGLPGGATEVGDVVPVEFRLLGSPVTDLSALSVDTDLVAHLPYDIVEVPATGETIVTAWVGSEDAAGLFDVTLTATSELTGAAVSATVPVLITEPVDLG